MTEKTNKIPTAKELDEMRKTGYKPTVVACFVNNKQVLLLFKKEYRLWMMPQTGVLADKSVGERVAELITDEMGPEFFELCSEKISYLGDDSVEFLPEKQTNEELETTDGNAFKMMGKHYYFFAVSVSSEKFDLAKTQFDEFYWFESKPALVLASKIYQPGKRRITMKAINLLKEQGFIN